MVTDRAGTAGGALCGVLGCGRPLGDGATVCGSVAGRTGCVAGLVQRLGEVPTLLAELETTALGQDRLGGSGGGVRQVPGSRTPRTSERAARAGVELATTLARWARRLGMGAPRTTREIAAWLAEHVEEIRTAEVGGELVVEVERVVAAGWRAVDRPADLEPLGRCWARTGDDECDGELRALRGADVTRCPRCGGVFDVAERRAWMREAARDVLLTAAEASRALPLRLGVAIGESTIRVWHSRGRLMSRGTDERGRKLFRTGDVLDLATGTEQPSLSA